MPFNVIKEFEFSAAHFLTKYHGKCENLHGHNYKLAVTVSENLQADDMVVDFVDLKDIVNNHVIKVLDHTNLNDRFPNPTCELIAQWIFRTLIPHLPVTQVQLWETSTSSVIYHE
ncbi:MAG: 6-carboxytetrahydropterin synthase QueD [Patescibacteria group bacterium]|jgi:6-pyruvoyltetrahydropterin/6-carboxytetrahydropterin synthase